MAGTLGGTAVAQPQQGNLYSGSGMAAGAALPQSDPLALPGGGDNYWAQHNAGAPAVGSLGGGAVGPGVVPNPGAQGPTLKNQNTGAFDTSTRIDASHPYDQSVIDAFYGQQKSMLDPQWDQRQHDQETQLANMGLSRGSAAWDRENENMNQSRTNAYGEAQRGAILAGGAEASRQENQQIAAQKAYNDAQAAQQAAAQGWEQFSTSRANAGKAAAASMHSADAARQASMYGTDSAAQLGNRSLDTVEHQNTFNNALRLEQDPYIIQNLQMQGMYPSSDPTFANVPTGTGYGQNSADYSRQIGAANNQGAAGINAAIDTGAALGGRLLARPPTSVTPGAPYYGESPGGPG